MSSLSSSTDLSTNALNGIKSLRLLWQQQLMPQEKPKLKERIRVTKKMSSKCVKSSTTLTSCFGICSKCTFLGDQWRHCILQIRFLLQPRASDSSNDSAIMYEYVRQSLIMYIVLIKLMSSHLQERRSFVFDKLQLHTPSPYVLVMYV